MQKIFDVQQFVKGRPPLGCKLYIGAYEDDPVQTPGVVYTAVSGGEQVSTPITLSLDGRPTDSTGNPIEIYADGGYSMQIVDPYGVHILQEPWRVLNAGGVGPSGTIQVGDVETLLPSQPAYINNIGTPTAAVLNFGIPQGLQGAKGEKGDSGNDAPDYAGGVSYDNSSSGLDANNVQDAIDELAQSGGGDTPAGDNGALQFNDSGNFGGSSRFRINASGSMELLDSSENVIKTLNTTYTMPGLGTVPVYSNDVWSINGIDVSVRNGAIPAIRVPLLTSLEFDYDSMPNDSYMETHLLYWSDTGSTGFEPAPLYHYFGKTLEGDLYDRLRFGRVQSGTDPSGKTYVSCEADEIHGLESRVGTFPLAFDIERTYGSKETPLTGNLGWTKSGGDKRVTQTIIHQDSVAPAELSGMIRIGNDQYLPDAINVIEVSCVIPNEEYFYKIDYIDALGKISYTSNELCDMYGLYAETFLSYTIGDVYESATLSVTDFISCKSAKKITLKMYRNTTDPSRQGLVFFDENMGPIEGYLRPVGAAGAVVQTIQVPENAVWFKTTYWNSENREIYGEWECDVYYPIDIIDEAKNRPYQDKPIFFSASINQTVNNYWSDVDENVTPESYKQTTGVVLLPDNYDPNGKPHPVIMYVHGHSHYVYYGHWGSTTNFLLQKEKWASLGFVVFDCNGARDNNKVAQFNGAGCPQFVDAYKKCFEYIKKNYNVEERVYVVGGSAGGPVGINFAANYPNLVNKLALLSPWTDIYTCSWGQNIKEPFVEYLGFANTTTYEAGKTIGADPALRILTVGSDEIIPSFPVQVKAWIGSTESSHVLYTALYRWINALRKGGNQATIREVDGLTHTEVVSGNIDFLDREVAAWLRS